jgi:hypothetical protein
VVKNGNYRAGKLGQTEVGRQVTGSSLATMTRQNDGTASESCNSIPSGDIENAFTAKAFRKPDPNRR